MKAARTLEPVPAPAVGIEADKPEFTAFFFCDGNPEYPGQIPDKFGKIVRKAEIPFPRPVCGSYGTKIEGGRNFHDKVQFFSREQLIFSCGYCAPQSGKLAHVGI